MAKKTLIPKVRSLNELRNLSATDDRYKQLLLISARNLGGTHKEGDTEAAYRWLEINAMETDEDGVLSEVNFCRDLVK